MDAEPTLREPFDLFGRFDASLATVLHAAHEAILMVDESQLIVAFNPAAERMFGCSAEEVIGQSLTRFIPAPQRGSHAGHVRRFASDAVAARAMAGRRPVQALRMSGEAFPAEIMLSRVSSAGPEGDRTYFAALMLDLSELPEGSVLQLQQRLKAVFELAPVALWIADDDRVVYANRRAARLFDADAPDALQGRAVSALLSPESRPALRAQVQRVLAGDTDLPPVAGQIRRDDGSWLDVEIAVAALPDHGHTTVQMVVADVTEKRRESKALALSERVLRQLSANVVEAREAERRRIARELHDDLGQRLTALKMELSSLAQEGPIDPNGPAMAEMLAMLDETVASVRRISADLRPLMLDDLGLNAAIEWLATDMSRRMGVKIGVQLAPLIPPPDDALSIALYRMVQEALTNVVRHAQATEVRVELTRAGRHLVLTVQDNGIGFGDEALQREGSYGLLGMRERALMLGGQLEIDNMPGGGGRVRVRVPIGAGQEAPRP